MNKEQLVNLVIIPTLKEIPKGISAEAVLAVTMIIAHESTRGNFLKQIGGGPALGIIQMEPRTHNSTWKFGDSIWKNAYNMEIISKDDFDNKRHPLPGRLIYDLRYNVFMARQNIFMDRDTPLPKTPHQMSDYLKSWWNSAGGEAKSNSYLRDYEIWR